MMLVPASQLSMSAMSSALSCQSNKAAFSAWRAGLMLLGSGTKPLCRLHRSNTCRRSTVSIQCQHDRVEQDDGYVAWIFVQYSNLAEVKPHSVPRGPGHGASMNTCWHINWKNLCLVQTP